MALKTPSFWQRLGLTSLLLCPFSIIYWLGHLIYRQRSSGYRAPVPVICIGNLTAGGAGKTPTSLALARLLKKMGQQPHFVYKAHPQSSMHPVLKVDPQRHKFQEVGDEALLLAEVAPTWVSAERVNAVKEAVSAGASVVILDDGFQNPTVQYDLAIVVVDGGYGFGNGLMLPAGPLREPVRSGLKRAQAMIIVGDDRHDVARKAPQHCQVIHANAELTANVHALRGKRVMAFAGIGRPEKFFLMLQNMGALLIEQFAFPDHYHYSTSDIRNVLWRAEKANCQVVTTAKDAVRLWPEARDKMVVADVNISFHDHDIMQRLLAQLWH